MAAEKQDITIYRGTAPLLRFVMTTNGSVAGWNIKLSARKHDVDPDPLVLDIVGTIESVGSATTPGIFNVALTKAQTLALQARTYAYSLERTDVGAEDLLSIGSLIVKLDVRNVSV
jgi:hypothetical protein